MFTYLANPKRFLSFERWAAPICLAVAALCLVFGLWQALFVSPADFKQGEAVRIMYVHVPAAWISLMAYTALTLASFISFVWRHVLADYGARAFALIGMVFTFITLTTGSLWGKTTWNTWWEWDGRMTSVLVLFFIYLAYLLIWQLVSDKVRAARLASIFAMVGFINIPIVKYSVEWWNSLHQPATISNPGSPGLPPEMLTPLFLMMAAFTAFFAFLAFKYVKTDILAAQNRRRPQAPVSQIKIETV